MSETLIALRIGVAHWLREEDAERLADFLAQQPGAVDELAFFTSTTHAPLPLEEVARRCARLQELLPHFRRRGYRVGINVLTSMGHHDEDLAHSLAAPWPRVTDPTGRVSQGSFCPGSPELLDYVDQLYTLVAQAQPDFIWVDDDVRLMGHMPIRATCFCEGCLARFNEENRVSFTRASLLAALEGAPTAERNHWRDRWLDHNRALIARLLRTAAEAVFRIEPTIQMGFMTGDRFYEGYDFAAWAEALTGEQAGPPRWRPGGGFYADDAYLGLVDKAHAMGRQVSQLPQTITVIQSEIENFPYQRLRKSVAITMIEAAAHMAAGTTGTAFNILGMQPDPLDEYLPFLEQIAAWRPWYQALRDATGRSAALGIWPAWNRQTFADHGGAGDWMHQNQSIEALRNPYVLAELGLPIAYVPEGAAVTALSGPLPAVFSRAELETIFRGGVLLDAAALQTLAQLGLAEWCGVRVVERLDADMSEVLTHHPLNGRYGGWSRDGRQSFWPQPAYRLEPLAPGVEVLAHLADYAQQDFGPTMTAFENALGGRVVVMGYYPWMLLHNLAKSSQLKAICNWLSRDQMPVVVESYHRAIVWARAGVAGRLAIVVLNASLDPAPRLELRIRSLAKRVSCLGPDLQPTQLSTTPDGAHHVRVTLTNVAPWSLALLLL
jgi:hypothetical protein